MSGIGRRNIGRGSIALAGLVALGIALMPDDVQAGPPFLTDDPEPTDTGHWEIYAPLFEAAGKGAEYDGSVGAELNYGAAPDLQLTLGLPLAYGHDARGSHLGRGDFELSAKYRFYHREEAGLSVAFFPGITLPTASHGMGNEKVTALLPVWAQKDIGHWSLFGGGGYAINPGTGNRDYWTGGIAVSREVTDRALVGVEIDRQGPDTIDGHASTSLGVGTIVEIGGPFRFLASGGPTFDDGGGKAGFHAFIALGEDF